MDMNIESIKKEILDDSFKKDLIEACRYDLITNLVPTINRELMKELVGSDKDYSFDIDSCEYVCYRDSDVNEEVIESDKEVKEDYTFDNEEYVCYRDSDVDEEVKEDYTFDNEEYIDTGNDNNNNDTVVDFDKSSSVFDDAFDNSLSAISDEEFDDISVDNEISKMNVELNSSF